MFNYTKKEMIAALQNVGIATGDIVLFYLSLGMLGLGEGVTSQERMNELFLECAREALGPEGTILIPCYSYSLCKGELFDADSTPGTIGPFPEFFRNQPQVIRSKEPILSICGQGPAAQDLFHNLPKTTYGRESVYERLIENKAKICTVGLRLNWATYRHYIEEIAEVPFRYRKYFRGPVLKDGKICEEQWTYSVRLWPENADPDGIRLAEMAVADGVCSSVRLGRNSIYCIEAGEYFEYACKQFKKDPWLSAKGPAADPIELEENRVPVKKYNISINPDASLQEIVDTLTPLPRHVMSDAYNSALNSLSKAAPLEIHDFYTGAEGLNLIVPEKWTCHEASLTSADGVAISSHDNPLHVGGHSTSFEGNLSWDELSEHLVTGEKNYLPLTSNINRPTWSFAVSDDQKKKMAGQSCSVSIKADFSFNKMRIGEINVKGKSDKTILLATYLDGACVNNKGLYGVSCGIELMRCLQKRKELNHSYKLLIMPHNFGPDLWLKQHKDTLPSACLNLEMDSWADLSVATKPHPWFNRIECDDCLPSSEDTAAFQTTGVPAFSLVSQGKTRKAEETVSQLLKIIDNFEGTGLTGPDHPAKS
ncbi:DUF4910 domain-containing protein [Desulfovibrio sp. JC022]|uniref:DUF4910 domain-containing protein n=1 Tax=Desulfovibrio sp. JC022 TaxID=2593642 RepID=UPI0013D2825E|nr:DUF4910 domain-containing protein [Desulfovibrio sp. JC022]NDV22204.1 DUF4910 domain-containing protein [Desulfovibrio sp. JC022]